MINRINPGAVQLATDKAAVEAIKGAILGGTSLLGVTGTLEFANAVSMTISATTNIDPAFTAALLADADFLWLAPNGTWFTGKAPAKTNFTVAGTYRVFCTDWAEVTEFDCNNDSVTALDVTVATALNYLYCHGNSLTALDVSANIGLEYLYCNNNILTALDVSTNTSLTTLSCGDNPLTALDVSTNTSLTNLFCDNSSLSVLDISTNTALVGIVLNNNSLTEAAVDGILDALVTNLVEDGSLDIGGTNAAPSDPDGWDDYDTLITRNWEIDIGPRPE